MSKIRPFVPDSFNYINPRFNFSFPLCETPCPLCLCAEKIVGCNYVPSTALQLVWYQLSWRWLADRKRSLWKGRNRNAPRSHTTPQTRHKHHRRLRHQQLGRPILWHGISQTDSTRIIAVSIPKIDALLNSDSEKKRKFYVTAEWLSAKTSWITGFCETHIEVLSAWFVWNGNGYWVFPCFE